VSHKIKNEDNEKKDTEIGEKYLIITRYGVLKDSHLVFQIKANFKAFIPV
jgi:hypothetical protein